MSRPSEPPSEFQGRPPPRPNDVAATLSARASPDGPNATPLAYASRVSRPAEEVLRLTPVYEDVEGGWTQVRLRELPAVITVAATRAEARLQLVDALREYLLALSPETPADVEGGSLGDPLVLVTATT